jgi:TolA-binding protein
MRLGLTLISASALTLGALTLGALTVSAPAFAQDVNVEGRVVKLEKEMRAVQRKVFPEGAGKVFEPEIKTPTAAGPNGTSSSSSAVSDLIARVDALETQLATLTGTVERQGNSMRALDARLKTVESQLKAQSAAMDTNSGPVEQPRPATPISVPTAKPPVAKPPVTARPSASRTAAVAAIGRPGTGDGFEDGYNYGYRLWEAKFFPEAQVTLQETVTKYPKHSRASYARNLLGRAWLDDKKPATAVKIFYDNYKNDPRGDRAPESLYFLGQSLTDLGKVAEACEAFGQLQTAYPDAATGRLSDRLSSGRTRAKCK